MACCFTVFPFGKYSNRSFEFFPCFYFCSSHDIGGLYGCDPGNYFYDTLRSGLPRTKITYIQDKRLFFEKLINYGEFSIGMRVVQKELDLDEMATSKTFFDRLSEADSSQVSRVIRVVNDLADSYFLDYPVEPDLRKASLSDSIYRGEPDRNYFVFRRDADEVGDEKIVGYPFFAVYSIGSQLTSDTPRDVDLMVVTNMWWSGGYIPHQAEKQEWFCRGLRQEFSDTHISIHGELPDGYNLGVTEGKCLITLTPGNGKSMDVAYVRGIRSRGSMDPEIRSPEEMEFMFISEEDFLERDVNLQGQALSRTLLYRAKSNDITPPTFHLGE